MFVTNFFLVTSLLHIVARNFVLSSFLALEDFTENIDTQLYVGGTKKIKLICSICNSTGKLQLVSLSKTKQQFFKSNFIF